MISLPRCALALAALLCCWPSNVTAQATAWTLALDLEHAAFPDNRGASSVLVHAPAGFDARQPLHLVVYLHGYNGCAPVLMRRGPTSCSGSARTFKGWALAERHDAAGTNTLFVVPQLKLLERDGDPGCFGEPGCFRRFVVELIGDKLSGKIGGARGVQDIASITLIAHSGGYQAALAILKHGEVTELVRHVILMDALYAGHLQFAHWLIEHPRSDARLVSLYLGRGKTRKHSELLFARGRKALGSAGAAHVRRGDLVAQLRTRRLVVARGRASHREIPRRHLAEVLGALPLPRRAHDAGDGAVDGR